jgi:mRNA interferase HigB
MRVISKKRLRAFWARHPDARSPLEAWAKVARRAVWRNLQEVCAHFRSAHGVVAASGQTVTVFNIRGNHYRLVVDILYSVQVIYVCSIMTHVEYDEDRWKVKL